MNDDLKARPIAEIEDMLAELLAEAKRRRNPPDYTKNDGKEDTAQRENAGDTTAPQLRKEPDREMSSRKVAHDVALDHFKYQRGTAFSFIRACRRLGASVSSGMALRIAMEAFPQDYASYVAAQNRGEQLPILFPKPGRKERLARAIANGGRLT